MLTEEDIRAAAYRASHAAGTAAEQSRHAMLTGSSSAKAALDLAWLPLTAKGALPDGGQEDDCGHVEDRHLRMG